MSEQAKSTLSGTFSSMKEGVGSAKAFISNPENQEKVRRGINSVLAGAVGILNTLAYTASTAVVSVKNGVVDGVADADRGNQRR